MSASFFKKLSVTCPVSHCRVSELAVGEKLLSLSCRVGQLSISEMS